MSLTSKEVRTMLIEIVTGQPPSLRTPEADAKRAKLRKEVERIEERGGTVVIPPEMPV